MTDERLKPCPLCGGEAVIYGKWYIPWAQCRDCMVQIAQGNTVEDVIENWNMRAELVRKNEI